MSRGRRAIVLNEAGLPAAFTLNELCAANPEVKKTTVTAHVKRYCDWGRYLKTGKVMSGHRGKPAIQYMNMSREDPQCVDIPIASVDESNVTAMEIPIVIDKSLGSVKPSGMNSDVMSRLRFLTAS